MPLEGDPAAETAANYDAEAAVLGPRYLEPSRLATVRAAFLSRLTTPSRIADVGCGPGRDVAAFRRAGHDARGFDRSRRFVDMANATGNGPVEFADMRSLPLATASMDAVWCAGALVHLPRADAPRVLSEFRRVTRAGGLLCVVVKEGSEEYWRPGPGGTRSYVTTFGRAELDRLLDAAGYDVVSRAVKADPSGARLVWMAKARGETTLA